MNIFSFIHPFTTIVLLFHAWLSSYNTLSSSYFLILLLTIFQQQCSIFITFLFNPFQDWLTPGLSFPHLLCNDSISVRSLLIAPIFECQISDHLICIFSDMGLSFIKGFCSINKQIRTESFLYWGGLPWDFCYTHSHAPGHNTLLATLYYDKPFRFPSFAQA